ncbi:unnamed protein product [Meganyctiphanes norvegica]|uniref:Uncharacterized protein n=1 Tax=Meganyctiphanes norvegica TaxID=48144 RepID=A0AAV2R5T8_MEGNR
MFVFQFNMCDDGFDMSSSSDFIHVTYAASGECNQENNAGDEFIVDENDWVLVEFSNNLEPEPQVKSEEGNLKFEDVPCNSSYQELCFKSNYFEFESELSITNVDENFIEEIISSTSIETVEAEHFIEDSIFCSTSETGETEKIIEESIASTTTENCEVEFICLSEDKPNESIPCTIDDAEYNIIDFINYFTKLEEDTDYEFNYNDDIDDKEYRFIHEYMEDVDMCSKTKKQHQLLDIYPNGLTRMKIKVDLLGNRPRKRNAAKKSGYW